MSRSIARIAIACLLAWALFGSSQSTAGEQWIYDCNTIVDSPGRWVLSRNLVCDGADEWGVAIGDMESVEVDLNGFSITGGEPAPVIVVRSNDVRVHNGTLAGGEYNGILVTGVWPDGPCRNITIEDVTIVGYATHEPFHAGIQLDAVSTFTVRNNQLWSEGSYNAAGIRIRGHAEDATGTIEHNVIEGWHNGISVHTSSGVSIRNNRVTRSRMNGIAVDQSSGTLIANNTVRVDETADGDGMRLTQSVSGSKVFSNVIHGGFVDGIGLWGNDNQFLDNVVSGARRDGLHVQGHRNHLECNVLNLNGQVYGGFGLWIYGNDNTYGRNTARGNPGGTCSGPLQTTDLCVIGTGNSSFQDNFLPDSDRP